jgi:hypothetical protein
MENTELNNLIVNNIQLETLEARIRRFNPFRVLNIETNEVRHSNVLAWLLNPEESHNLGDKVFKKLVSHTALENEDIVQKIGGIEISQIQLKSYHDLIIHREYKNIDILAISKNHRFILLIENKIKAKESRDQLKRYLDSIQNEYSPYIILPIFLSLDGQSPLHDKYCALDYPSLLDVIEQTVNLYKDYLPIPIRDFISFYLESLRGAIEMDEITKKLCRDIYDQHKEALDLIYQVVNIKETAFAEASQRFLESHFPRVISTSIKPNTLWTTLTDFATPKRMAHKWNAGHPVAIWFVNYYGSLKIILEVGPFDEPNKRIAFLEELSKVRFKIGDYSKKQESRYTRLYTKVRTVNDWDDVEELAQLMSTLFDEIQDHIERMSQIIKNFDW